MFSDLSEQVTKTEVIEAYCHLSVIFDRFKKACEKALVPANYFGARFEARDVIEFVLYVFDIPVRVVFSCVQSKSDEQFYGKMAITCNETIRLEDITLLVLYFDKMGNIKEDINQKMNFRSMQKPEDIEYVLWAIVTKLIELPFFERV